MNHNQVETASTAELVEFYNENCADFGKKTVKKFADRATAIMRVRQLIDDINANEADDGATGTEDDGATGTEDDGATDKHANLSAAVSATWTDPEVAAARKKRYAVVSGGVSYKSVEAAFRELGLPINKAAKFRAVLRDEGTNTINDVVFTLGEVK